MEEEEENKEKQEESTPPNEEEHSEEHSHDEEKGEEEVPTPIPVLENHEKEVEHKAEEKSKYQQELEDAKKKSSNFYNNKKPVEVKATTKVTRSDYLSRLEVADIRDQSNPHNQKYMPFDGFKGPASKRKLTDGIFLFIFIVLNGGLFINAMLVFVNGSSNRLMNGTDFRSEICGVDQRSNLPYLYYLEPLVDTNVAMCVSNCPNSTGASICLYKSDGITPTPYCYIQIQTKTRGKYCIPTEPINKAAIEAELDKFNNYIKRVAGDLGQAADIICLGCVLSIFLAWAFQELLKSEKYVKFIVWGCIWGTVFCIMIFGVMCYLEYKRTIAFSCLFGIDKHDCGGIKALGFYYSFIGLMALIGVYLLVVMKLFNRINLAIGIIKASGKVSRVLEQIKKIPLIIVAIALVIGIFLLTMIIMAFSIGTINTIPAYAIDGGLVKVIEYDNTYRLVLIGDFAMLIYWLFFVIGFSDIVTSYSLCIWFFTKKKETVLLPVNRALKDTILYHLGTVLMIVLLAPLSAIPKAIFGNVKKILKKSNQKSCLVKSTISGLMCCFFLYDKFFRFHSYQTYVQVAMWSLNHRKASQKAYFLIDRHKTELRSIDFLQRFVIFQTKLCCSLLSCIFVYLFITFSPRSIIGNDMSAVETPFGPAIFVLLIAFFFSTIFQGSFDIIGKTILQCYLMDIEMFIGDQRYIEPFLRDFLQFYGLKAERKKIEVEADRPNYVIGVTVAPLPPELQVKADLEVEDFSESPEESEEEEEDSEQSIELMPTNKPKQVSRGETGASRPGTGQSGVEGFQGKRAEMGRDVFLDDLNNGKKTGIDYDPFSYVPVKNASNSNPSRPVTNDLNKVVPRPGTNNPNSRPVTNDFNKQTNNSRPQSIDLMKSSQSILRPTSNDFTKQVNNSNLNLQSNQRPTTNDFNSKPPNIRPTSIDGNLRPMSNDGLKPVSRPLSKDSVNVLSFGNSNPSMRNPVIEVRPKSKDQRESGGAKLELVENRPMSKDNSNKDKMMGDDWFIKPPKQDIRPNSKDMFTVPKGNNKMDLSVSIDLFDKGNKIEPMKIDNFSMDEGNNNSMIQKSAFRLN